jgi:hypothetical protein
VDEARNVVDIAFTDVAPYGVCPQATRPLQSVQGVIRMNVVLVAQAYTSRRSM